MAALLAVSPPHISGIIEPLRRKGLLKRHWGASDRRQRFWRLTPAGRGLLDCVLGDAAGWAHHLDGAMGADRAASLARLLDQLAAVLQGPASSIRPAKALLRRFDPAAEEATGNEASGKGISRPAPGRQGGTA